MRKLLLRFSMLCVMLVTAMAVNAAEVTAKWDFKNNLPAGIQDATNFQGNSGDLQSTVDGILMHVDATSGKLYCVGRNNAQMNPGAVLQVPVYSTKDVVTVEGYPGYCHFAVGGEENGDETTVAHTATTSEVRTGYVEVTATAGNNYIYCVTVEIDKMPAAGVSAKWDFKNNLPAGIQEATNFQGNEGDLQSTVEGILMHVDATAGKLYCVGRNNAQMNPGTVLQVPVYSTKDVVTVEGYPGYCHFAVGGDENGDETTVAHTATASEVRTGYVEVTATAGNNYIYCVTADIDKLPAADITGTWDYANTDVMAETMALSGSATEGTVKAIEDNGLLMTVAANGATFRNNGNNIQVRKGAVFKVPVKSTEDVVTVYGYPGYSYYTIGNSEEITNTGTNPSTSYTAKNSDVSQGYVSITSTNDNNYFYKITVLQKAQEEKPVLENVPATATFPFNLGTEGQKAEFGDAADYFLASKVEVGSGLFIKDKNNGIGFDMTRIEPYDQNNNVDETNKIQFIIQPKYGLTFTPKSVAFKTTRFGTDNGLLDIAWLNADGTTVTLATGVKPNRNSGTNPAIAEEEGQKFSNLSYEVTGATPGEGPCGLQINLYHLQSGKQVGFADIVIVGEINGQEVEVPMLASFTANGKEYLADDVFTAEGSAYKATIELFSSDPMISAENPVTDVSAYSGEIGEITYNGNDDACVATIPVSLGNISIDYIINFVRKPFFTLTYYDTDNTTMGKQQVEKDTPIGEFAIDFNDAKADEGYKVRGWFEKSTGGRKFTTADIITADAMLFAMDTEIEEASTYKKYNFDLTSNLFYPEDHEAFVPVGGYWHDVQHGWAFKNGDRIELLVGPKASVSVTNCRYGDASAELVFTDANGNEVGRIPAVTEGDGEIQAIQYEGEPGKLYIDVVSSGEIYIHSIRIVNTAETSYASNGNWYFVKPGDAESLIDVLDVVNGINGNKEAERSYIFLPDGVYDLREATLTAVSGNNISLIGQSMEGTIIKNTPFYREEGISKTATLLNSGQNLYMQDITLQNALDYYGAQAAGLEGGRAVCLQDRGDRAIFKNVTMLSYQDTYYSQNTKQSYWEDCDIHGTVDFLCGGGDVRFQNTILSLEPRNISGTGGRTITAPTTTGDFGYVFDNCKVVDLANGKGDWNFGRTWQNNPIAVYLNTTLDNNAAATLVASRWVQKGMNNRDPRLFGEYGTINEAGENITPASNIITSYGGQFETILTAEQAAEFTYDKMFKNNANAWDPASLTLQKDAPEAAYNNGELTWQPVEGAIAYAIFKNDIFQDVVIEGNSFAIEAENGDVLTIRSANSMGGFGEAATVEVQETALLLDENVVNEIPAVGTEVSTVNTVRTLVGGNWNTICLPFAISANELANQEHPFYGAQIMALSDATYDEAANAQNIEFFAVDAMEAGIPYVIKVDADVVNPTFHNVVIGAEQPAIVEAGNCTMYGLFNPYEFDAVAKNIFFLSAGNKFSYVGEPGTMKGMRAYFEILSLPEGAYSNINMTFGGATGIKYVGVATSSDKIYDLQGRQVNNISNRGVYIINGRKYVK